ncbi:MAG: hypothetical protein JWP35_2490 [Caulobacter sp.]|nr:hypothetical protein [Caulobacter sp.]
MAKAQAGETVRLRLVLTAPPKGAVFSLQGKDGVVERQSVSTGADLVFDLVARVSLEGPAPRWLGDYVRGGQADRFFYFASGVYAGEPGRADGRRGKVALWNIPEALVHEAAKTGAVLQATTPGADKHGLPACASVKANWALA